MDDKQMKRTKLLTLLVALVAAGIAWFTIDGKDTIIEQQTVQAECSIWMKLPSGTELTGSSLREIFNQTETLPKGTVLSASGHCPDIGRVDVVKIN